MFSEAFCAARSVFCDEDGGQLGKPESRIQIRIHQTTIAQSNDKGKTATPRYSQVRYAPASLGKMKRLMTNHTQTAKPNATRMRSPGVSDTDQMFSI